MAESLTVPPWCMLPDACTEHVNIVRALMDACMREHEFVGNKEEGRSKDQCNEVYVSNVYHTWHIFYVKNIRIGHVRYGTFHQHS